MREIIGRRVWEARLPVRRAPIPGRKPLKNAAKLLAMVMLVLVIRAQAAISIQVSGSLNRTIGLSDLQGGAGTDLKSFYESGASAIEVEITGTTGSTDNWQVDISKVDTHWLAGLQLYIRRSADGVGDGAISGGTSYQEVGSVSLSFFTGRSNRTGVTVQFKLTGVSVHTPPASYSSTVYFTVIDTI
jgi:hypothetical protein